MRYAVVKAQLEVTVAWLACGVATGCSRVVKLSRKRASGEQKRPPRQTEAGAELMQTYLLTWPCALMLTEGCMMRSASME